MRFVSIVAAVCVLCGPAAALAGEKVETPKAKKVCTIVEPAVGRIPAKRVCRTVPAPAPAQQAVEPQREADAGAGQASSGNR
jgi:hypothetical protein